jgi:hypothetical protein
MRKGRQDSCSDSSLDAYVAGGVSNELRHPEKYVEARCKIPNLISSIPPSLPPNVVPDFALLWTESVDLGARKIRRGTRSD